MLIKPCREFCESVRDKCEQKMTPLGYTWPVSSINCEKYPSANASAESPSSVGFDEDRICLREEDGRTAASAKPSMPYQFKITLHTHIKP